MSRRTYLGVETDRHTKHAYRAARRQRRPKFVQVPTGDGGKRTIVVPHVPSPISWSTARKRAAAYVRILESKPTWPTEKETAMLRLRKSTSARPKKVEKYRRHPRGEWWMSHFADAVERRRNPTKPTEPAPVEPPPTEE